MKVAHSPNEIDAGSRPACLAIGFFDGVHLGHQQVIKQTIADARQHEAVAVIITFDRHPNSVVAPNRIPALIYSLPQKLRAIAATGADSLLLIHFDEAFSRTPAEDFIRSVARDLGRIQSLCVGANFVFGHKRSGNVSLLQTLGEQMKFTVHGLAAVSLDGKAVSSTRIREAISAGDLDAAGQMLGRSYALAGTVIRGEQMGRRLGFPTANLDVTGLVLPPNGVYAVHADAKGKRYRAVLNIGTRPTLNSNELRLSVEAHLLDYEGDLYGEELELSFVDRLRDERKFPSVSALQAQISLDIQDAKSRF
jgi:riboflavin kinase/FMN adenylyltransferase